MFVPGSLVDTPSFTWGPTKICSVFLCLWPMTMLSVTLLWYYVRLSRIGAYTLETCVAHIFVTALGPVSVFVSFNPTRTKWKLWRYTITSDLFQTGHLATPQVTDSMDFVLWCNIHIYQLCWLIKAVNVSVLVHRHNWKPAKTVGEVLIST